MEITTTTTTQNPSRRAAINTLAAVGFVALLFIGIALAIYSARYVPLAVSRISTAAVSLSSVFHRSSDTPALQVVSVASTTLPIDGSQALIASSTPIATTTATTTTATTTTNTPAKPAHTAGTATGGYTVTTTTNQPIAPYGDPDLVVRITSVGYLTTSDVDSYVSGDVPNGKRGAFKFTVTNAGTNVTGSWKFRADVPMSSTYTFTSPTQPSLNPGDSVDFVLGFDKPKAGDNRTITVMVDSGKDVHESNEGNNEDSRTIDVR
ncbi:MAG: CARDB domain-containing protein [Patescibacteria group bacterium]